MLRADKRDGEKRLLRDFRRFQNKAEEREIKRRISARHEISSDRNQGDKEAEAKFKEMKPMKC